MRGQSVSLSTIREFFRKQLASIDEHTFWFEPGECFGGVSFRPDDSCSRSGRLCSREGPCTLGFCG